MYRARGLVPITAMTFLALATSAKAQRPHLLAAAQFVSQDGPLGGYAGVGILVAVATDLHAGFGFGLSADFAALRRSGDDISVCLPAPGGGCLTSPSGGASVSVAATAEWGFRLAAGIRPFVAAGPVYGRSLGASNVGTRRDWVEPSAEAGLRIGAEAPRWSLSVRWRRVDSWADRGPYTELGLLVGFLL